MKRALHRAAVFATVLAIAAGATAYTQQSSTEVFGGRGGSRFADPEPQAGTRVLEVHVRAGDLIDSIQLMFALPDGRTAMSPRHGGSGGRSNVFRLDSDEYITGLSGRCGDYVDSIRIHTNRRTSPVYGGRGGDRDFRVEVPPGYQGAGFTGREGDYVDAIGLVLTPLRQAQAGQTSIAGGRGGSEFTDRDVAPGAGIVEVRIQAGDHLDGIQAVYSLPDGRIVEGPRHGGRGGRSAVFRLEADEYVTGISGRYGNYVDSIRIHTNRRTSPLYGGRGGNRDFRIDVPPGTRATGFTGRAADLIDAIGLTYSASGSSPRRYPRIR